MHLAVALWAVLAALRWGNWKHFDKYHKTLLFIVLGGLLYEFFEHDYILWQFKPDLLTNTTIIDLVYNFITMPFSVLVYLSTYPEGKRLIRQVWHIVKWILIYSIVEFVGWHMGRVYYEHGWNMWWSFAFDCQMFPMLRLHFKKPILAYIISVPLVAFLVWWFHVPLK
jgi:hypothetical protein